MAEIEVAVMQAGDVKLRRQVSRRLEEPIKRRARFDELVRRSKVREVFGEDKAAPIGKRSPANKRCNRNPRRFEQAKSRDFVIRWRRATPHRLIALDVQPD